jgi:hypothetical protein
LMAQQGPRALWALEALRVEQPGRWDPPDLRALLAEARARRAPQDLTASKAPWVLMATKGRRASKAFKGRPAPRASKE